MQTPSIFMDYLKVQDVTEYSGLAVFPLTLLSSTYEAMEPVEVIGDGTYHEKIKLIETGVINSVRIENHGELPALVLDGSILKGGAANRMLTASAVIRKGEIVKLPVVSVEEKRWDCETFPTGRTQIPAYASTFSSSDFAPASLRRARLEKSLLTMKKEGISRVEQDMIWIHITDLFKKSSLESEKFDVCELYANWDYLLEEYSSQFKLLDMQIGCIVFLDQNTWYLHISYNLDVFRNLFPNLLKSYALGAILRRVGLTVEQESQWAPELINAQDAFAKIKLIKLHTLRATGREGEEIGFFVSEHACGTVLTDGPILMHMAVFSR